MWNKAYELGWAAWFGAFLIDEFYALIFGHNVDPMLTQVTVKYVPKWITLPFIVWLFVHFALRYFNSTYVKDLGTNHPYKGFI